MMERSMELEHGASSLSNDARLWRKLLEKAKKGTATEPHFVADVVLESLQPPMFAKLGLPAAFLEHHRQNLTENIVLEGPDGQKWRVMLGLSLDSKPCLLHGWLEFATDFDLAVNDQILFLLWEDSHFLVQVFDSNHNIKRRGGGTSAHIARAALLPQLTDPMIQSFGYQGPRVTRPSTLSLLGTSNDDSRVAKNAHKENHTTQASPSAGEKLCKQEPGVEEDEDDRVADFNADSGEVVGCFQSTPPSDAEEDRTLSMERARNPSWETAGRRGGELHKSPYDPVPEGTLSCYDYLMKFDAFFQEDIANAGVRVRKWKERDHFIEEKIPEKRARQPPTDRSQAVSASTSTPRQASGMKTTSPDVPNSRATKSAPPSWNRLKVRRYGGTTVAAGQAERADAAKAREAAKAAAAAAIKEGEATVPVLDTAASDPVTPLPVEAPKQQVFKRPQPRNPSQIYFSKRRPVTLQEREAALEAGQRYAAASYNSTHVMQLRVSQVYCGRVLGGTLAFATAMDLPLQALQPVTLYDGTGRTWDAVWHGEHPKRTGLDSAGWTRFVLDHRLEEGDVLVFELPDPKACNICVTVFPVVTLAPCPSRCKDHYSMDRPQQGPAVVPAVVQPEADFGLHLQAILPGQSSSFEKEDSDEIGGKRRRLGIGENSGEEEMNKCGEEKIEEQ